MDRRNTCATFHALIGYSDVHVTSWILIFVAVTGWSSTTSTAVTWMPLWSWVVHVVWPTGRHHAAALMLYPRVTKCLFRSQASWWFPCNTSPHEINVVLHHQPTTDKTTDQQRTLLISWSVAYPLQEALQFAFYNFHQWRIQRGGVRGVQTPHWIFKKICIVCLQNIYSPSPALMFI